MKEFKFRKVKKKEFKITNSGNAKSRIQALDSGSQVLHA
jgi:hypothetical protein